MQKCSHYEWYVILGNNSKFQNRNVILLKIVTPKETLEGNQTVDNVKRE